MTRDIIAVQCVGGYRLRLTFEGGEQREIDVQGLVPLDGVFEPLKDTAYFRRVRVEPDVGTIVWPSGADLCPDVLYENSRPLPAGGVDRECIPPR